MLFQSTTNQVNLISRSYGFDSLEDTIGKACAICAEAVSTYITYWARGDTYMHILETVYFTFIFVLRSIHELVDFARMTADKLIYMVLRTLACWMDAIVYRCLHHSAILWGRFDLDLLKSNIALYSLALMYVLAKH